MGQLLALLGVGLGAWVIARQGKAATREVGAPVREESTGRQLFGYLPGAFNVFSEPASEMDWDTVRYFAREEFVSAPAPGEPEVDCTPYLDASIVRAADQLRRLSGERLIVSPAPGAIVRTYGNPDSDHYVGALDGARLSHALDLMVPSANVVRVGAAADSMGELDREQGGVGVYPDWQPYPGVHISNGTDTGRWMAVDRGGKQEYLALDWTRVRAHLGDRGLA